jgi:hypothetical protein
VRKSAPAQSAGLRFDSAPAAFLQQRILGEEVIVMRRVTGVKEGKAGRVLVGPKKLGAGYARIVSERDGSGRIESFNLVSKKWLQAPDSVTFADVWSAPAVPFDLVPGLSDSA